MKLIAFCLSLLLIPMAVQAQDRVLSQTEIRQFFDSLGVLTESLYDTTDIEISDRQREDIADQYLMNYTRDMTMKTQHQACLETGKTMPPERIRMDRGTTRSLLIYDTPVRNMKTTYQVQDVDLQGSRATVEVKTTSQYEIYAQEFKDIPKIRADVQTISDCTIYMIVDYDGAARIRNENCKARSYIENTDVEWPDYMLEQNPDIDNLDFGEYIIVTP